ncbi:MAG: T9SS type B sorting domain-containing protein, partial [Aureispira sp.]|nr:T9SS type B sorting domain-containing protein [Aureispira sp.]
MRYLYKSLFLFVIIATVSTSLKATHIVGGEMTYECLGNNQYKIYLTVFRDCENGVPDFDFVANIAIYEGDQLVPIDSTFPGYTGKTEIDASLEDTCLTIPPNVCIEVTTYTRVVTLPYSPDGYRIAYQRCCRNNIIENIILPESTGATFQTYISPEALLGCNSSPTFDSWPPVYICQGVPINYDHSGTDVDGDSIVYELCTPLNGGTVDNPRPFANTQTLVDPVIWNPPYGINNMLGDPANPLSIDPVTGLLTGTPPNLGTYLVGICIKEYRNGVLLSITRRDFQYTIGVCGRQVSAAFYSPTVDCDDDPIVAFNNSSQAVIGSYQWNFGDTASSQNTSQFRNPTHVFSDTGAYLVTLIVDPGTYCADTSQQWINVQLTGVDLEVSSYTGYCAYDTVQLYVTNKVGASLANSTILWSPNVEILSGQGTDTILVVADTNKSFNVVLENEHGCKDSTTSNINIDGRYADAKFQSSNGNCNISLDISFDNNSTSSLNTYLWDFGDPTSGQNTSTSQNPTHSFSDTGTYEISLIVDEGTFCADTIRKTLDIRLQGVDISVNTAEGYCPDDSVQLFVTDEFPLYTDSLTFTWSPNAEVLSGQGTDSVWVLADADKTLEITAINHFGCTDTASSEIITTGLFPPLDILADTDSLLKGQYTQLVATNDIDYVYTWAAEPSLSSTTIYNPVVTPTVTTVYNLTVTNSKGCSNQDSIVMNIKPPQCSNPNVFVPNAFTPNNDGQNDILYVRGANIRELYFAIYDRWGEKVFETTSLDIGWDGTFKGKTLPPDVFGYYLD